MKTCCPGCQTVFRVTSEQLKARAGKVRCGQCRKVFNALDSLLDDNEAIVTPQLPPSSAGPETVIPAPTVAVLLRQEEEAPADDPPPVTDAPASAEPVESIPVSIPAEAPLAAAGQAAAAPEREDADSLVLTRETREAPDHDRWLEGVPSKPVPATAGRSLTMPFAIAIVLLVLTLAGQFVFHFRGVLALTTPGLRPTLAAISAALGTDIPLPRHPDLVSIEASDLQTEPGRSKLLALQATLRNRASYAQAYPAIELTLTDTDDKAVARRVFLPDDYLPPGALAEKSFRGNSDVEVRLWLDAKEVNAAGYRLYVFYP